MLNKTLTALAVTAAAFAAMPAQAADWGKTVDICAAAAEAEGLVTAGQYRAKFVNGSGAATKTVAIELTTAEGEAISAVCKVRRGEVTEFTVKA